MFIKRITFSITFAVEVISINKRLPRLIALLLSMSLVGCGTNTEETSYHKKEHDYLSVYWKNYNGDILQRDNYRENGDEYVYYGATPTREKTVQYTYTFNSWSEPETDDDGNIIFTAQYDSSINHYNVYWVNYDGVVLQTDYNLAYGTLPTYEGDTPRRESTSEYVYTFAGWFPEVEEVEGETIYTATYTNHTIYPIIYHMDGGQFVNFYKETYTDLDDFYIPAPVKQGYTFIGWATGQESANPSLNYHVEKGTTGKLELYAYYVSDLNNLVINVNDINHGSVEIIDGRPHSDEDITIKGTPAKGYCFATVEDDTGEVIGSAPEIGRYLTVTIEKPEEWTNLYIYLWKGPVNNYWPGYRIGLTDFKYVFTFDREEWTNFILNNGSSGVANQTTDSRVEDYLACDTLYIENRTVKGNRSDKFIFDNEFTFTMPTRDYEITCNFELIDYQITYNLDGGTNSKDNPSTYTINDEITLSDPQKNGYTFLGWYDDNNQKVEQIPLGSTENITLNARWNDGNTYVVTLDPNGGAVSQTTVQVQYDHDYNLPKPEKFGYRFEGWYLNDTYVASTSYWRYAQDVTLTATWSLATYMITYALDEGVYNDPNNPSTYDITKDITLYEAYRYGYTFAGWQDEFGRAVVEINGNYGRDLILYATWNDGNKHTLTLDPNYNGSTMSTMDVQFGHEYTIPDPERKGYKFEYWFGNYGTVNSTGTWFYDEDITLKALWTIVEYKIKYNLNGGAYSSSTYYPPTSYKVTSTFDLPVPVLKGYHFEGWLDQNNNLLSRISAGMTGDLELTAQFAPTQYQLVITVNDSSLGSVQRVSGSGYYLDEMTYTAIASDIGVFIGWYDSSNAFLSAEPSYSFTMPDNDVKLVAKFTSKENIRLGIYPEIDLVNSTIKYGLYPQTIVSDENLIASLNALGESLSTAVRYGNDYYIRIKANPENDSNAFSNGQTIVKNQEYWFKYERITWNILSSSPSGSGTDYYLLANICLDARQYDGDSNNYKNSDLRTFLNSDFYSKAFALSSTYVTSTTVNNGAATTVSNNNVYYTNNTTDKVFMPSYQDYINESYGFNKSADAADSKRYCFSTDYAKANGCQVEKSDDLYGHCEYMTRSPYTSAKNISIVRNNGTVGYGLATRTWRGVRPAIHLLFKYY